jgi:hypothetical protein
MRQTTETKTSRKKPLLDQLMGKDTVVEERKVTTTTVMPDGSKKIETRVEKTKIDNTPKKVTKTYVREKSPARSQSSYSSPALSNYSSPSSSKVFCSGCGRAAKPNAKFWYRKASASCVWIGIHLFWFPAKSAASQWWRKVRLRVRAPTNAIHAARD